MRLPDPVKEVVALLEEHGYQPTVTLKGHFKIRAEGLPMITCSCTSSDWRGRLNTLAIARRFIKAAQQGAT